jgi:hypothetical protein
MNRTANWSDMTLPETDLRRIRTWARGRVPEHLWPELKVEADVADRYVDIVEVRPPWDGVGEHTMFPIARLRYTKTTGQWAIYWRDRHLKFHEYKRKRPTKTSRRCSTTSRPAETRSSGVRQSRHAPASAVE